MLEEADTALSATAWRRGREGVLGVRGRTGRRWGPRKDRWGQRPSDRLALRWANWEQAALPKLLCF